MVVWHLSNTPSSIYWKTITSNYSNDIDTGLDFLSSFSFVKLNHWGAMSKWWRNLVCIYWNLWLIFRWRKRTQNWSNTFSPCYLYFAIISVEGFVMDKFCVDLGTLLDKPDLISLQFPSEHSLHWYVCCFEFFKYNGTVQPSHLLNAPLNFIVSST